MTATVNRRAMALDERVQLEAFLANSRFSLKEELALYFGPWASLVIFFVIAWALMAWLGRVLFHVDFGWSSQWGPLIFVAGLLLSTLAIALVVVRSLNSVSGSRLVLQTDLAGAMVTEERLRFTSAKRFQEPEHGGLIYFLRTTDNRVFVLFDHESQDLGVEGKDPLASTLRPQEELVVVRAPTSRRVLSKLFSGPSLDLPPSHEITVSPAQWPASEEFCSTPWNQLEAILGRKPN